MTNRPDYPDQASDLRALVRLGQGDYQRQITEQDVERCGSVWPTVVALAAISIIALILTIGGAA